MANDQNEQKPDQQNQGGGQQGGGQQKPGQQQQNPGQQGGGQKDQQSQGGVNKEQSK